MNPYYEPEDLGFEMLTIDNDTTTSYEFDYTCFWKAPGGEVYSAHDSGCSCPTPFENYEGSTISSVVSTLERIGSLAQAESIYREHAAGEWDKPDTSWRDVETKLREWGLK